MTTTDKINIALTAVIASATVAQVFVAVRLASIESGREKIRLLLRFVEDEGLCVLRVANLSGIGVFIERVQFSVVATLPREVPAVDEGKFQRIWPWIWRRVLPAYSAESFTIDGNIRATIEDRHAEFECELEAAVVYVERGRERTTRPERQSATIHQLAVRLRPSAIR